MLTSSDTYVVLLLVDLRALERLGAEWVADLERLRVLGEALEELVVDVGVHENTRTRAAALPMVIAEEPVVSPGPREGYP